MSTPFVDSVATELRITSRIFQETWGGLRRSGWMNWVIIVTMASILTIFGVLSAFVMEAQIFVAKLGSGMKISVYVKPDTDLRTLEANIQSLGQVDKIQEISRQTAWDEMRRIYDVPDIQNPLPDTLHVQMKNEAYIPTAVQQIQTMPGVEKVSYPRSVLNKIQSLARISSMVGLGVCLFLGTLTLFIISNTIHLLIEARSREIEILRMMGVGNWYIRLPFLLQGAIYGLVGALIAFFPLSFAEQYINALFNYFQFSTSDYSLGLVFTALILMGILVGAGGSYTSVHKFLKI